MDDQDLKLGQLFMAGFDGMIVDGSHSIVQAIVDDGLGGVILFDRNIDGSRQNISSPGQLAELTSSLQHYADNRLLIAVDQEGGNVCRLKEVDGFTSTRTAAMLAENGQPEKARGQAEEIAATLRRGGVNFNLAPVVDLDLNPDNPIISRYQRSYGADPVKVVEFVEEFIAAHHDNGIACCIKHFPGHGSARDDSHLGFVDITDSWQEEELEPYARLFSAGFGDAVMTAHVIHRGLDKEGLPATLSRQIITGLLRERFDFDGVIVSDDLQMKAISDRWTFEEAVQMAIIAGVDLLIIGNNLVREEKAVARGIKAVRELLDSGRIEGKAVQRSLERVNSLKKKIAGVMPWKSSPRTV